MVRSTFEDVIDRMKNALELASMFEDSDKVEDRDRVLRKADDVITTFLRLVNDYYRLELQLRFKEGIWQDSAIKGEADILIQRGFAVIETMRIQIVEEPLSKPAQTEQKGPKTAEEAK